MLCWKAMIRCWVVFLTYNGLLCLLNVYPDSDCSIFQRTYETANTEAYSQHIAINYALTWI